MKASFLILLVFVSLSYLFLMLREGYRRDDNTTTSPSDPVVDWSGDDRNPGGERARLLREVGPDGAPARGEETPTEDTGTPRAYAASGEVDVGAILKERLKEQELQRQALIRLFKGLERTFAEMDRLRAENKMLREKLETAAR